jgi:hypothetical protein
MGFVMGSGHEHTHLGSPKHKLRQLLASDPAALQDILAALSAGQVRFKHIGQFNFA